MPNEHPPININSIQYNDYSTVVNNVILNIQHILANSLLVENTEAKATRLTFSSTHNHSFLNCPKLGKILSQTFYQSVENALHIPSVVLYDRPPINTLLDNNQNSDFLTC